MIRLCIRKTVLILGFVIASLTTLLNAQQLGRIDSLYYSGKGIDNKCTGGLVLPDNSIIVTGKFAYANERLINSIVKLLPDGSSDNSFNIGTGADNSVNVVVRQPDGKLIIGGDFVKFNGLTKNRVARLNADGSNDASFNTGTGFNGSVYAIYLQPDGKILMGGAFYVFNGDTLGYFLRLNADGTRDTSFHSGTGFGYLVYSIDRQSDGKYIVAGDFSSYNGTSAIRIARIDSTGVLDNSFNNSGTGPNGIVTVATVLPNGKIIAGGFFATYNGTSSSRIARINNDGSLDNTFLITTGIAGSSVNDLCVQPDGKIIATGNFSSYNGVTIKNIVRIDTVGNKDATFNPGSGPNLSCNAVFMNPDGKIYVGGTFIQVDSFARLHLARLLATGKVDHSFFQDSKLNGQIYGIGYQKNGKAIIGGLFTKYNQVSANRIARLNNDGSLDGSFNPGSGANGTIWSVTVLSDDKILIGGDFTKYNNVTTNRIARLNADGSLDNTFITGTGANGSIYSIKVLVNGKILIGGKFTSYNGTAINRIARLTGNGALDNSFTVGSGFNNTVQRIVVQPDGKIIAGGVFTTYAGITQNRIIRLDTSGVADNTFTTGAGASNTVFAIALQPDGKILIGGAFTKYNNVTHNRVARLNTDGTIDATYTASLTPAGQVNDMLYVANPAFFTGGLLLGGTFTTVNGVPRNRLVFLDNNGAIDSSNYYIGTGSNNTVNVITSNPILRHILVGGDFNNVQNHVANRLAPLKNTNIDFAQVSPILCPGAVAQVYFGKTQTFYGNNNFVVQLSDSAGDFANAINVGTQSSVDPGNDSVTITIPGNIPAGNGYLIRIISTNPNDTSSISGTIVITPPTPQTITASGSTTLCSGGSITLSVTPGGQYAWSNGATTADIVVTTGGTYSVTTNFAGCVANSPPVTVNVIASPDSSATISHVGLCGGGNATLTAAPGLSYLWSTSDTTQSINVGLSGVYTVSVTAANGCGGDSSLTIDFNTYFSNLITAAGPTTFCQGGSVTLSSLPGLGYQWSSGGSTQSIVVTATGDYIVTVNDGPCADTSAVLHVTVNPLPNISFSLPGDTICSNSATITLSASPSGGTFTGNGVTGSTFDPQAWGNTKVVIAYAYTDGNSCSNAKSDSVYVNICTAVQEVFASAIQLYPNPTKNEVFISSTDDNIKNVEVFNMLGEPVLFVSSEAGVNKLILNITSLATGNYFVKAGDRKFRFVKAE